MFIELEQLQTGDCSAAAAKAVADYIAAHPSIVVRSTKTLANLTGADMQLHFLDASGNEVLPASTVQTGKAFTNSTSVFTGGVVKVAYSFPDSSTYIMQGFDRVLSSPDGLTSTASVKSNFPGQLLDFFLAGELSDNNPTELVRFSLRFLRPPVWKAMQCSTTVPAT